MKEKSSILKYFLILLTFVGLFFIALYFVPDSWIQEEINTTHKTQADENTQKMALKKSIPIKYKKTQKYQSLEKKYREQKLLENIFTSLEEFIKLPSGLTAEYSECGEENAFYDAETKKISICYEIIEWAENLNKDTTNKDEITKNILTFFILHEIGHALIDLYELPITGREEDVADQLATFFLLGSNDDSALDTADSFYSDLGELKASELPFSDEHSLDNQRYYNILCWVYGSDTKNYAYLVKDELIPAERAELCESEFISMNNSFLKLLDPYIKK